MSDARIHSFFLQRIGKTVANGQEFFMVENTGRLKGRGGISGPFLGIMKNS